MIYKFNTKNITKWIHDFFETSGLTNANAIIGISGGKDSSIVAQLCVNALGKDRVLGILMPNGLHTDATTAKALVEYLDIEHQTINIETMFDDFNLSIYMGKDLKLKAQQSINTNLPARIRMIILHTLANTNNGLVSCNANRSEAFIGWTTLYGDSAGAFAPLLQLTCTEVIELGKELEMPEQLYLKIPEDGMCGKTDEEAFGFSYKYLDSYITYDWQTNEKDTCLDININKKIESMHKSSKFKRDILKIPHYEF